MQLPKPPIGLSDQQEAHNVVPASGTLLSSAISLNPFLPTYSGESLSYDLGYTAALDVTSSNSPRPLDTFNSSITHLAGADNSYDVLPASAEDFDITKTDVFKSPVAFGDMSLPPIMPENVLERQEISSTLTSHSETPSEGVLFANHKHLTLLSRLEALNRLVTQPVLRAPRSFRPRQVRYRQLSLNRKFVICTLSAYPHMLLPGKGMPPFIHPRCLIQGSDPDGHVAQALPGPLATCAGIVALWSVKNRTNSVFVWRAIRAEQERLLEEVYSTQSVQGRITT